MQLSDATYRAELEEVAAQLEPFASHVSVRGDGPARFVFARSTQRAVEISKTEHQEIWVEFWRGDSRAPTREEAHPDYESAVASVVPWLRAA